MVRSIGRGEIQQAPCFFDDRALVWQRNEGFHMYRRVVLVAGDSPGSAEQAVDQQRAGARAVAWWERDRTAIRDEARPIREREQDVVIRGQEARRRRGVRVRPRWFGQVVDLAALLRSECPQ